MSPAEVARMRATLRFLREHRNTLKLKVNAAEDLLLNGRREPTHRGLCQHLLSKLDRTRVLQAAERMPPAQATEFLAGIVRFAPEVPYLLEFLRAVKASEHPRQAAAALTQALERVDFAETSTAQLRDLLQLVVDVFPASELPVFVFSLLSGAAFRSAFDRSSEGLPSSLAELLVPLRSLHRALGRRGGGRRESQGEGRLSLEQVRTGALLLLGASRDSLLELAEPLRRQLLDSAADAFGRVTVRASSKALSENLLGLFTSLEFRDAAARASVVKALASGLLRAGVEPPAIELLRSEQASLPDPRWAQHWLAMLAGTRAGELALERRARRHARRGAGRAPASNDAGARRSDADPGEPADHSDEAARDVLAGDRWQRAFHVPTQQEVLVRFEDPAAPGALLAHAELRRRAILPGIAPLVSEVFGLSAPARDQLVLAWQGPQLPRRLPGAGRQEPRLPAELALGWCREACRLLAALAAQGLELPDAAFARFSVDADERLWLVDLWLLREAAPAAAGPAHLGLAQGFCRELLEVLDRDVLSQQAQLAFEAATSFAALLGVLSPR
jgi:hypothetical protein